jgi:hypothetical protein
MMADLSRKASANDDEESTDSGSTASRESLQKDVSDLEQPAKRSGDRIEEDWYTPSASAAECREADFCANGAVEAALAAALAIAPSVEESPSALRLRGGETPSLPSVPRQDWWDQAESRLVPGLEDAASLTRLLDCDIIRHAGLSRSKRPAPWAPGESHDCYERLGAKDQGVSYLAWWLGVGESSVVSISEVIDRPALERCLANDPLGGRLKLLLRAVKCSLPFPAKGPKEADTVGYFFGKGASLTRSRTSEGVDVVVINIDLYYLRLLRFALQNIGFRPGNVVEALLVDWPGQAVLAAQRLAVTDDFLKLKG